MWKQTTGVAKQGDRYIRFGLKGSADITGILKDGRRIEIECKSGAARQSKDQQSYQKMIEKFGGVYLVVRSVEDANNQLQKIFSSCA